MSLKKCIMCGKSFDPDQINQENINPYLDDEDQPKKSPSFCQLCEAKIRYESDEAHKNPR